MTLGRLTRGLFSLNFSKKITIPSASHLVLKAFQSSFKSHPSSYTALPLDGSRVGCPLINPVVQAVTKRAFSSSSQPPVEQIDASFLSKALKENPNNIPEVLNDLLSNRGKTIKMVLKELPALALENIHFFEEVVLALVDKNPILLLDNLSSLNLSKDTFQKMITKMITKMLKNGPRKLKIGKDLNPFYSLLERVPHLPLDLPTKKEFYEQALFIILNEENKIGLDLEPLLEPNLLSETCLQRVVFLIGKSDSSQVVSSFLEKLQRSSLEEDLCGELVVHLAKTHPEAFSDHHLSFLKEKVLKKVIFHIVNVFSFRNINLDKFFEPVFLKDILKKLASFDDKNFINDISLKISKFELFEGAFALKDFPISDEKTFKEISKNLILRYDSMELVEEIMSQEINDSDFIQSIAKIVICNSSNRGYKKLKKINPETNLPFFVDIFKLEDLSLRKEMAKNILKDCDKDSSNLYGFSNAISILGLEKTEIVEEILSDVCRSHRLASGSLAVLSQSSLFAPLIPLSFFLKQWGLEDQEFPKPPSQEFLSLIEVFDTFFNKPEIKRAFDEKGPFKENLLSTLYKLDHKKIPSKEKLSTLLAICQTHLDPLPPVEEITGNMILEKIISSSSALNYSGYTHLLEEISSLKIQNPAFFENMALTLADKNPDFLLTSLEYFEISNPEILEKIAIKFIHKSPHYFLTHKQKLNLSKESLINVATGYARSLQEQGKCRLSLPVITEVFIQIKKCRNEALSELLEKLFFENIASTDYQKTLGFYIATEKGKGESISLYKILPSLFLSTWDAEGLEKNQPYRKIFSDFLGNSSIKLTLKNANKSLAQNLLLAAFSLEKDTSLNRMDKIKIFASVCDTPKEKSEASILEVTSNLKDLRLLCSLKLGRSLNHPFTKKASEELSTLFQEKVIKRSLISSYLEKIENIEQRYLDTFVTHARIPGSLATYESGFHSLSGEGQDLISPGFLIDLSRFAHMCLEKAPEERYRLDINPDLQELSEKFPEVFNNWKQSLPPIELEFSPKSLEGKLSKEINNLISSIENTLKIYEKTDLIKAIYANLKSFPKTLSPQEKLEILKNIEKDLHLVDPIPMDAIKNLETAYLQLHAVGAKQKIQVKDIDDPLTLFEMPTLVGQCCQKITSSPMHNQCLLSYAIEGSTRMMAVEDTKGNFLARSVLRICFDENQSPFLLLEPVYHSKNISNEEAKKYLYEGALQKAESLNIPVFTETSDGLGTKKTILSKGVSSNTYYSDLCMDSSESPVISGKIPQKLSTHPLTQIKREEFFGPIFWPKKSSE